MLPAFPHGGLFLTPPTQGELLMSTTSPAAIPSPVAVQPFLVRRAAVLGAGTMGSRIAAHLANAGIPVSQRRLARSVRFVTAATAFREEHPGALYGAALVGAAG